MAWLKHKRLKSGTISYSVAWRAGGAGSRVHVERIGVMSRRQAEKRLHRIEQDLADGRIGYVDPKSKAITFEAFAREKWLPRRRVQASTDAQVREVLDRYLIPAFGPLPLRTITREDVEDLVARIAQTPNPSTGRPKAAMAEKTLDVLRAVLGKAEEWEYIMRNVARRVPVQYVPGRRQAIPVDHVVRIIELAPAWWRPLLAAAVLTGLRKSELFALTRSDVLWETDLLLVNKQRTAHDGPKDRTKSGRERSVDLLPEAKEILADVVLRDIGGKPGDLLFTTPTGAPIHHRNFDRRVWAAVLKSCGYGEAVADADDPKRMRFRPWYDFHELRHTFGSWLLYATADLSYVADQLGHTTTRELDRVYRHTLTEVRKGRRLDWPATRARLLAAYRSTSPGLVGADAPPVLPRHA